MKIDDTDRKRYINYIKDYTANEDMDYDIFLEDCLEEIKNNGIKSLDPIDVRILANLFFEIIYKTKSKPVLNKAIQLYYDYDTAIKREDKDIYKFASEMINIYKNY